MGSAKICFMHMYVIYMRRCKTACGCISGHGRSPRPYWVREVMFTDVFQDLKCIKHRVDFNIERHCCIGFCLSEPLMRQLIGNGQSQLSSQMPGVLLPCGMECSRSSHFHSLVRLCSI